jgi:hypothetical protein
MAAVPLKRQYGPTLGVLLAPRWRSLPRVVRVGAMALLLAVAAAVLASVLALEPTSYSHGGSVPFGFQYKGLHRTAPGPGGYVRLVRESDGRVEDSYSVAPLRLAPYRGSATGELPLYATGYAEALASRLREFRLEGEGKTRINSTLSGYEVLYSAIVDGRLVHGRDVMLLPGGDGAREGVIVKMLSTQAATTVSKPVGSSGVLERPLKTFSFQ